MKLFDVVRVKGESKDELCQQLYGVKAASTLRETKRQGFRQANAQLRRKNLHKATIVSWQVKASLTVGAVPRDERNKLLRKTTPTSW